LLTPRRALAKKPCGCGNSLLARLKLIPYTDVGFVDSQKERMDRRGRRLGKDIQMKASRQNSADILAYTMAYGAVSILSLFGLSRIDLLLSEPFGSLMVFSRTVSLLGLLAGLHFLTRLTKNRKPQPVRVRA